jgi:hypothetical protein
VKTNAGLSCHTVTNIILCVIALEAGACSAESEMENPAKSSGADEDRSAAATGPTWRVDETPTTEIGCLDDNRCALNGVTYVAHAGAGKWAVANARSGEIHFYSTAGRRSRLTGRLGNGPGEFRSITWLRYANDTLSVFDPVLSRITYLSNEGTTLRTEQVPRITTLLNRQAGLTMAQYLPRLANGNIVTLVTTRPLPSQQKAGLRVDSASHYLYRPTVNGAIPLPSVSTALKYVVVTSSRSGMYNQVPFGLETHVAVGSDRFYVGTNDVCAIDVYDGEGRLVRRISCQHQQTKIGETALTAYRQFHSGPASENILKMQTLAWEATDKLEHFPQFADIRVDDSHNLWVLRFPIHGVETVTWDVFDSGGDIVGHVVTPAGFRNVWITQEFFVGMWQDKLGVEYVRMYKIHKDAVHE